MNVNSKYSIITASLLLTFCMAALAQHQDSLSQSKTMPWFVQKFQLTASFFLPSNNTNVQVGVNGNTQGTDVDLENDLDFAQNIGTLLSNFQWRISRRSLISASFLFINRRATPTLKNDLIFKEDTFRANQSVNCFFNTSVYQISYGYAIFSKPKFEAGLMIGAHVVGAKTGISSNDNSTGASVSADFGFTAPLPDLGIWGGYAFSKRLALRFEADYLSLTVGDVTGSILAYNVNLIYNLVEKFELSLGFTGLNCKVDVVNKDDNGHIKWGYNGPTFGATFSFGKFRGTGIKKSS